MLDAAESVEIGSLPRRLFIGGESLNGLGGALFDVINPFGRVGQSDFGSDLGTGCQNEYTGPESIGINYDATIPAF